MQMSRAARVSLEGATTSFPLSENITMSGGSAEGDVSQRDRAALTVGAPGASQRFPKGRGAKRGAGQQARMKGGCISLTDKDQWCVRGFRQASDLETLSASQRW